MKVTDSIRDERLTLSFEVFPPKTSATLESVLGAANAIAELAPSFMSVTYGAGGGSRYTLDIARELRRPSGVEVLAHLTCTGSSREEVSAYLDALRACGIENVMALRGDLPAGQKADGGLPFPHASDLIAGIRARGGFCIGAACYPEVHPESACQREDLEYLRRKVEAGADFLTTQMFFDNRVLYSFLYKLREAGVTVPVVPGIMPITGANQLRRAVELSHSFIPRTLFSLVDRFGGSPEAMKQAGIMYAVNQIFDLYANGIRHVHVYSMNKPDVAAAIMTHVSVLLGKVF